MVRGNADGATVLVGSPGARVSTADGATEVGDWAGGAVGEKVDPSTGACVMATQLLSGTFGGGGANPTRQTHENPVEVATAQVVVVRLQLCVPITHGWFATAVVGEFVGRGVGGRVGLCVGGKVGLCVGGSVDTVGMSVGERVTQNLGLPPPGGGTNPRRHSQVKPVPAQGRCGGE